jgi:phospholipid/cholesterol/gamma-HCH transport system permease protein
MSGPPTSAGEHVIASEGERGGEVTLFISGRLVVDNLRGATAEMRSAMDSMSPSSLAIDLSGLTYMDSAGALVILQAEREARARSVPCRLLNPPEQARRMLAILSREALEAEPVVKERKTAGLLEQAGESTLRILRDAVEMMAFLGDFLLAMAFALRHPRSVRWGDIAIYIKRAGIDAVGIVGLLGFLLGVVIAIMALSQLSNYGGNVILPSIVSIAMVKEFGPVITSIIVAGRSGSAFAAEIATMEINEEVDALLIMGFDPVRFLVISKVLAAIIVVPTLALLADFLGILGGLVVAMADAGLTFVSYMREVPSHISVFDAAEGIIKSGIFGAIIGGVGCQRGLRARGGAEEVGAATTSAVVTAIFLIILTDAALAMTVSRLRG